MQLLPRLALGSLPTSVVTLAWLHLTGADQMRNGFILNALGDVLLLTALAMVFKTRTHALGQRLRTSAPDQFKRAQPALTVVAGAILGFLVTLTSLGAGAGALGAVMLLNLYPWRMTPARLVGTDIVLAIPLTLVAGTGHLLMGHVDFRPVRGLLLGSVPGGVLGSLRSSKTPENLLRHAIAAVLTAVDAKLVVG